MDFDINLQLYGSIHNGLAHEHSDIDIRIKLDQESYH